MFTVLKINVRYLISLIIFFNGFLFISNPLKGIELFKLEDIEISSGSPFYQAQQANLRYLFALDVDRLLAPFFTEAGIQPKKPNYGNWESMGLNGHTLGHYLSAISQMYAATKHPELKARIEYIIQCLDSCQKKNGNGYVGGIPQSKALWEDIEAANFEASSFSLSNRWVPFYNLHKTFAGLVDAYTYAHNTKSLEILIKLTDWIDNLTKNLTDTQIQMLLQTEHGGLNESFVQVYHFTKNPKYLNLAIRFSHKAILDPLKEQKDILVGLHANTQIPKIIGFKCIADATGDKAWEKSANFFWDLVVKKYTISIGGHGVREHFNSKNDFLPMIESNQGPESCNTYNMLKLTKLLFVSHPRLEYIDYYERALYNHILSTIHRTKGGFVYFTPIRPCHYRVFSTVQNSFWCCVGTGMENHTRYGELIYAKSNDTLLVNLFIPSILNWKDKGVKLIQQTQFPYESSTKLTLIPTISKKFSIKIRKPSWVKSEYFDVQINGKKKRYYANNGYIVLTRKWKSNDKIVIEIPMNFSIEYLPDNSSWASILYGPIVLASACDNAEQTGLWADDSRMAHVANGPLRPFETIPHIISYEKDFSKKINILNKKNLTFSVQGSFLNNDSTSIVLQPFFEIDEMRYTIYFPVANESEWEIKKEQFRNHEKEKLILEQRTIDIVLPGEQQSEVGHNFKGEKTETGFHNNRFWRHAYGWFSYDLVDKYHEANELQLTLYGLDNNRSFDVLINDFKVATIVLKGDKGDSFFNINIAIPESIKNKSNNIYTVKFKPVNQSIAGGIYEVRLLK